MLGAYALEKRLRGVWNADALAEHGAFHSSQASPEDVFYFCRDKLMRLIVVPWGAGLVNMDIGSGGRLVQHSLQIPAHASNRFIPPYLF
eukprot:1151644-Pelagomonas_calceolata.AAC.1